MIVPGTIVAIVAALAYRRYGIAEAATAGSVGVAYIAAGLLTFRFAIVPPWVLPAGLALAALEITNISLEQFIKLPSPANAIVPASMMALLVLFASTSAVIGARRGAVRGVMSAVMVLALGMSMSVAAALLFAERVATADPQGLSRLMLANAAQHLTAAPVVALIVGFLAAALAAEATRHRASMLISLAGVPLLVIGIALLVHAASLPRSHRPAFVMPGMAISAIALICAPCFLDRPRG